MLATGYRGIRTVLSGVVMLCLCVSAAMAEGPVRDLTTLAVTIDGDPYKLEALIVTPPGKGPFPLVVLNHGSPRNSWRAPR